MVTGSAVLFGLLLRGAGLSVSVLVLALASSAASIYFRWRTALILAVGLIALSALLFVKGLGLPIPLIGTWFGG
jgi:hypothetical protein